MNSQECVVKVDNSKEFMIAKIKTDNFKYEQYLLSKSRLFLFYNKKFYDRDGDSCLNIDYGQFSLQRQQQRFYYFKNNSNLDDSFKNENCSGPSKFSEPKYFTQEQYKIYRDLNQVLSSTDNYYTTNDQGEELLYNKLTINASWDFYKNQQLLSKLKYMQKYPNFKGQYCLEFYKVNLYKNIQAVEIFIRINLTKQNIKQQVRQMSKNYTHKYMNYDTFSKNLEYIIKVKFYHLNFQYVNVFNLFQNGYILFFSSLQNNKRNNYNDFVQNLFHQFLGLNCDIQQNKFICINFINIVDQIVQSFDNLTINNVVENILWKKFDYIFKQYYEYTIIDYQITIKQTQTECLSQIEELILEYANCFEDSVYPYYFQNYNQQLLNIKFKFFCNRIPELTNFGTKKVKYEEEKINTKGYMTEDQIFELLQKRAAQNNVAKITNYILLLMYIYIF